MTKRFDVNALSGGNRGEKMFAGAALISRDAKFLPALGASDDCVDCLSQNLVEVPATLFRITELDLPLTDKFAREFFAQTISMFAGSESNPVTGISANTIITNAAAQPFVLRCVAPFLSLEALGFSANGEALPFSLAAAPGTATPAFDGVVPIAAAQNPQLNQAWMEWGIPTWKAVKEVVQAYRLQMPLGNTFILFDELVADIGTPDSHNPWEGYSNSLVAIPEYVRHINDNQRTLGTAAEPNAIFLPATAQNTAPFGQTPVTTGVPTPLVGASWGGPCLKGLYGGCYPSRGILFPPAWPIYLNYVRDQGDSIYYNALIAAVTNNPGFTYDANLAGTIGAGTSQVGGALPAPISQGFAEFVKFVGGKFRFGATMRGANLTPRAVIEWYAMMSGYYGPVYQQTMIKDWLNPMFVGSGVSKMLGYNDEGVEVTKLKKSDLLARLARARQIKGGESRSHAVLSSLAGTPGIDEDTKATRTYKDGD